MKRQLVFKIRFYCYSAPSIPRLRQLKIMTVIPHALGVPIKTTALVLTRWFLFLIRAVVFALVIMLVFILLVYIHVDGRSYIKRDSSYITSVVWFYCVYLGVRLGVSLGMATLF